MCFLPPSVEPLSALGSSAVATDLVRILRRVKLVVETQLEAAGVGGQLAFGELRKKQATPKENTLTSSPFSILRTELMMIL